MNAFEYLANLREIWFRGESESSNEPPYFSAEGKRLRREATKRRITTDRGKPVAGTGKGRRRYSLPKHYDCFGECICKSNRTKRERDARRFEDKAN